MVCSAINAKASWEVPKRNNISYSSSMFLTKTKSNHMCKRLRSHLSSNLIYKCLRDHVWENDILLPYVSVWQTITIFCAELHNFIETLNLLLNNIQGSQKRKYNNMLSTVKLPDNLFVRIKNTKWSSKWKIFFLLETFSLCNVASSFPKLIIHPKF